ncbi:hypothetical protein ACF1BQ_027960 [Bradyrhizobium sp. RDT10]
MRLAQEEQYRRMYRLEEDIVNQKQRTHGSWLFKAHRYAIALLPVKSNDLTRETARVGLESHSLAALVICAVRATTSAAEPRKVGLEHPGSGSNSRVRSALTAPELIEHMFSVRDVGKGDLAASVNVQRNSGTVSTDIVSNAWSASCPNAIEMIGGCFFGQVPNSFSSAVATIVDAVALRISARLSATCSSFNMSAGD